VVVHKNIIQAITLALKSVSVMLVYERNTGIILGGTNNRIQRSRQAIGCDRLLQQPTKINHSRTLQILILPYSPPIGTANDALNMACVTLPKNKISGF